MDEVLVCRERSIFKEYLRGMFYLCIILAAMAALIAFVVLVAKLLHLPKVGALVAFFIVSSLMLLKSLANTPLSL